MIRKTKIELPYNGPSVLLTDPAKHWATLPKSEFTTTLARYDTLIDYHVYGTCYYAYIYKYTISGDCIRFFNKTTYTNEKANSRAITRTISTFFNNHCKNAILLVHTKKIEASKKVYKQINLAVFSIDDFSDRNQSIITVNDLITKVGYLAVFQ